MEKIDIPMEIGKGRLDSDAEIAKDVHSKESSL